MGVFSRDSISSIVSPGGSLLAVRFVSRLAVATLSTTIDHRAHSYKVANAEFRNRGAE
jgi:hypothetical protein